MTDIRPVLQEEYEAQREGLEREFETMVDKLISEAWVTFAEGENWERDEPYHKGCGMCQERAAHAVAKALNLKVEG